MSSPREAAALLMQKAKANRVRFPKVWEDSRLMQECGKIILTYKNPSDGSYDIEKAAVFLVEKYGSDIEVINIDDDDNDEDRDGDIQLVHDEKGIKGDEKGIKGDDNSSSTDNKKKRKSKVVDSAEMAKKRKKSETYTVEGNKPMGDAIYEMAGIFFKNADPRKGGVFSKAAKAIRECDFRIVTAKDAMKLPGVGKGIAAYIEELQTTGMIQKLEEMRAGNA